MSTNRPISTFTKTIERSTALIDHYDTSPALDEKDDLLRAAVVISVAAFDRFFTARFCDVLVPHLKKSNKLSEKLVTHLSNAGLDTEFALELAVSQRPFRKIRTIVQNSLSRHTTHRTDVIDDLFLSLSLKNLCKNAEKKASRRNLRRRIEKLVDIRNEISHQAHVNQRGNPKTINSNDIRSRISDLKIFVEMCDEIISSKFGSTESISA